MSTRKDRRVCAWVVASGVLLAATVPAASALQPEPQMMFEMDPAMGMRAYDEARARQVAAQAAQASGELASTHARLPHAAFLLLSPEQRKRMDQCKPGTEGAPPPSGCFGPPR